MTNSLSHNGESALNRALKHPELLPLLYNKVKGLYWFDVFKEKGLLDPLCELTKIESDNEIIPNWSFVEYLVNSSDALKEDINKEYAIKYLDFIKKITHESSNIDYIGNYRTWWQFSKILTNIPFSLINEKDLEIVDIWLNEKYETGIVVEQIGKKWLPLLLNSSDKYAHELAESILQILFKVNFEKSDFVSAGKQAKFRFENWDANEIVKHIAKLSGEVLGKKAVSIYLNLLRDIISKLNNDDYSAVWQRSIEEHEQNQYRDDVENILVYAFRDCLTGYLEVSPGDAVEYVVGLFDEEYQTIQRVAIYMVSLNIQLFDDDVVVHLLNEKYFNDNYQHEMWHFLNKNYDGFSTQQKQNVLKIIDDIIIDKGDENTEGVSASYKAIWLSSIKDYDDINKLYIENIEKAGAEPEHPDFSYFTASRTVTHESPYPEEELKNLSINKLITKLKNYKDPGQKREPGIEGLLKTCKKIIKNKPEYFCDYLTLFLKLDIAYQNEIIEAYRELWSEKYKSNWDKLWTKLLEYCLKLINEEEFWEEKNAKQREQFIANRFWVVSSIGRLIEDGTKNDNHAFKKNLLEKAKEILLLILKNEKGEAFKVDSDAVSIAINSPRGRCIEALISLTLRNCRIVGKEKNKDHEHVWQEYREIYDEELTRFKINEYEFSTLATNYLQNFLYMSKDWTLKNMHIIFNQDDHLHWLCAMKGYSYAGPVYQEPYEYLKNNGDYLRALNDKNISRKSKKRFIDHIAIAYIKDFEDFNDTDSLINVLITRNNIEELRELIWFIWTRRKDNNEKIRNKVYKLWPAIMNKIDFSNIEGQKLASQLCHWSVFIDLIDETRKDWLIKIAPYSEIEHNSHDLLKSLARISAKQPFEAQEIWLLILEKYSYDYPTDAIKEILKNLLDQGNEGKRKAKKVTDTYFIKYQLVRPMELLRELDGNP